MKYFLLLVSLISVSNVFAAVDTVTVSVETKTYNGRYAPRNAAVIWIQKSDKTFIKTICKRAQNYIRWCTVWNGISRPVSSISRQGVRHQVSPST